eukprot:15716_1
MALETKSDTQIRLATVEDVSELHVLYTEQYPIDIQKQYKSISKYVKKALKTDLKEINKHYLNKPKHGLWVSIDTNTKTIIGMIGIRENNSWKANKNKQQQNVTIIQNDRNKPDKPDFDLAYKLIDDVIDILLTHQTINHEEMDNNEAEIMRFGVSKTCRRMGVGTALLNHVKQFCIDNNYKSVIASTMNVLEDAIMFYKSTGFVLEHTEPCGNNSKLEFLRFRLLLNVDT